MSATTTTPARPARTDGTKMALSDAIDKLRRELVAGSDEDRLAYLAALAAWVGNARRLGGTFRMWSGSNRAYLEAQRRAHQIRDHLGLYAGRKQWAALGRAPMTGESPLYIWAFTGPDDDGDDGTQQALAPAHRPRARPRFLTVPVFDYTQTAAVDPDFVEPRWDQPIFAGSYECYEHLVAASPWPVEQADLGGAITDSTFDGATIRVRADLPVGSRILALVSALAAAHGNHQARVEAAADPDRERALCAQEAACAAWVAAQILGLDTDGAATVNAASYLRAWDTAETGRYKRRMKALTGRVDTAIGLVETILADTDLPSVRR